MSLNWKEIGINLLIVVAALVIAKKVGILDLNYYPIESSELMDTKTEYHGAGI